MTDKTQHCNHEKICVFALQSPISDGCPVDKGIIQKCKHDTRSRPAPLADALGELEKLEQKARHIEAEAQQLAIRIAKFALPRQREAQR